MSSKYRVHFTSVYSFSLSQYLSPVYVTPLLQPIHHPLYPSRMPVKPPSDPEPHTDNENTTNTMNGEAYEPRQTGEKKEDWIPRPERSLRLDEPKRRLLEDVLKLYGGEPTVERVRRYTRDAVYDDPLSYASDRYVVISLGGG